MPKTYINDGGVWRRPKEVYINDGGTWRDCAEVWVRRLGVWRQIFKRALQLQISADVFDYDLYSEAGSPSTPVDIVLTIGLDVIVGASSIANYALGCSTALPAGSTVRIINKGRIMGAGGDGGDALFYGTGDGRNDVTHATDGGPALQLGAPTVIDNGSGYILGGGGGGGAMHVYTPSLSIYNEWLYAGGGGAGSTPGEGGTVRWGSYVNYAPDGSQTSWGTGRNRHGPWTTATTQRIRGGGFGEAGQLDDNFTTPTFVGVGDPGDPGRAVDLGGYSLTLLAGENADQIKGAYD